MVKQKIPEKFIKKLTDRRYAPFTLKIPLKYINKIIVF